MAKLDPEISDHLHKDLDVTVERLRGFGKAGRPIQLKVLAQLRATAADQSNAIELAIIAVMFTLVGYFVQPSDRLDFQSVGLLGGAATGFVLGGFLIVLLLPVIVFQLWRNGKHQCAQVWLAAYEDELERRRSRK